MKTVPVINISHNEGQNIILREYLRKEANKTNKILLITPPKQKQEPIELISELENEKILEKLKQFSKEIFGK